jgi:hypothetical protein
MRYLVLKPNRAFSEREISKLMGGAALTFLDPTIDQEISDFYDDVSTAYAVKHDDPDINWEVIQIFVVSDEANSSFFTLSHSDIILGKIELNRDQILRIRENKIVIDNFRFYGRPSNDAEKESLAVASHEITTYITNVW